MESFAAIVPDELSCHAKACCRRSFDGSRTGRLLVPPQKNDSSRTMTSRSHIKPVSNNSKHTDFGSSSKSKYFCVKITQYISTHDN